MLGKCSAPGCCSASAVGLSAPVRDAANRAMFWSAYARLGALTLLCLIGAGGAASASPSPVQPAHTVPVSALRVPKESPHW